MAATHDSASVVSATGFSQSMILKFGNGQSKRVSSLIVNDWKLSCGVYFSSFFIPYHLKLCGQMIGFTFATGTEVVLVPKAVGTARLEVEVWVGCGGNKLEHM